MDKKWWHRRKAWFLRKAWIDPDTLFTRQEIAELTGLSNDVLSFWTKRGLLLASEGGEGKGSHRRFRLGQVNIAAVCAVFRDHFGVNIATLTSLSELLQRSVKTFDNAPIYMGEWPAAATIAQRLHDFRSGELVQIPAVDSDEPGYERLDWDEKRRTRPANNETEIIAECMGSAPDECTPAALLKFAETLGPGHYQEARIAQMLLGQILSPAYMGDVSWLMRQTADGWDIRDGDHDLNFSNVDAGDFGPGLFVPIGPILRKIWGIPGYRQVRRIDEAREMEIRLSDHGITAAVTPCEDEEAGYEIHAPASQWQSVKRVGAMHNFPVPDKPPSAK